MVSVDVRRMFYPAKKKSILARQRVIRVCPFGSRQVMFVACCGVFDFCLDDYTSYEV